MITLQFSTTNHPISRLICWGTWSKYSHMDLVLPDGRLLGSTFQNGVSIRTAPTHYVRVARFAADIPFDPYHSAILTQMGKKYDVLGVLGFPVRRDWQDPEAWFCNELHAWAAEQVGRPFLRVGAVPRYRLTVRDILLSPRLIPIGVSDILF